MTDPHDAQALIARLEDLAGSNAAAYRLRVALVAALGYAYLFGVIVGLLVFVYVAMYAMIFLHQINFFFLKILWVPLVLAWLVVKSMWVSVPPPDGKEIKRDQAPECFDLIAETRTSLNGPTVHHVLISDEFNCGIVQIPKFGMFGWTRNYLVLGLPLMKALRPDEFRAVLAHEFGHLSGKHGKFSGWIYRVRISWIQVLTRVHQERHYASFLFERFLDWYAPYFNAYSFVLARAQEYEADSYSVDLAGKDVAARALIQIELKNRLLGEEFWTNLFQQANDSAQPPANPFAQMLQAAQSPISELSAEKMLGQLLRVKTGYDDTHPALAERLSRLGVDPKSLTRDSLRMLTSVKRDDADSAAERYLRLLPPEMVSEFDRLWREQLTQPWHGRHEHVQQTLKRLDELEHKLQQQPLTLEEEWERVRAIGEVKGSVATLPVVKKILKEHPDHAGANWVLGAVLVEQHDPSGVEYLEKAMRLDPSATGAGWELIYDFYHEEGKQQEAETYRKRSEQYHDALQRHHEQALNLSAHDRYEPHGLEPSELAELQIQLGNIRGLATAYLVRKPVEGAPEPLYVLAVLSSAVWVNGRSKKDIPGLLNELGAKLEFSRSTAFVSLDAKPFLANPIKHVSHSQIYPATT